jgi:hypothetical protein
MKPANLKRMTVEELVQRFSALAIEQGVELDSDDIAEVNRLYGHLEAIEAELKDRPGDARRALLRLYDHPNMQVRLKAVKATLAIAPEAARRALEAIAASHEQPQAGSAGMSIWALDEGIYKPK